MEENHKLPFVEKYLIIVPERGGKKNDSNYMSG